MAESRLKLGPNSMTFEEAAKKRLRDARLNISTGFDRVIALVEEGRNREALENAKQVRRELATVLESLNC
jgi:hypothetical protein